MSKRESSSQAIDFSKPEYYINRELSLIKFNLRVLEQAHDPNVPLLEQLRYLCISSSNLDELFEVRIALLKEFMTHGIKECGPDGLNPAEVFDFIQEEAHKLVGHQYETLNKTLIQRLAEENIRFVRRTKWNKKQQEWVHRYFTDEIMPVLSPVGLDTSHPFPPVNNKSLNFIVSLTGKDAFGRDTDLAIVPAPRSLPRVIRIPEEIAEGPDDFVFLSSIIHQEVGQLFPGMGVEGCYQFRLTRNSNLFIDEEESSDLLNMLQGELPTRPFGSAVRLEVADNCTKPLREYLLEQFGLDDDDLYLVHGPVNLNRLSAVHDLVNRPELKFKPFTPGNPLSGKKKSSFFSILRPVRNESGKQGIFSRLKRQDILLHHPYQSFAPVTDFISTAASDPNVLGIKQTVYRTDKNSKIVAALIQAAQNGKDVTAVVELKARFDEEANISLAGRLQQAGVQVVYGVVGHKIHAKMMLVTRRESDGIRHYAHLGTGNYHAITANFYTDFGMLTANRQITNDVHRIFMQLTSLGKFSGLEKVLQAPFTLHSTLVEKIKREAENARAGKPARIIAKVNSLLEREIMLALYDASCAGVKIDLIVRGICGIRPGLKGISENICVRSIVGRFLEHHRIYYFENDGKQELFLASADWLDRNFFGRVETCFPVEDPELYQRVFEEGLQTLLDDNMNAWELHADGSYHKVKPASKAVSHSGQSMLTEQLGS